MAAGETSALHGVLRVDLQIACAVPGLPAAVQIEHWLQTTVLESAAALPHASEVSVRFVDENEMQALNKAYRDTDRPTNVLAFTADLGELPGLPRDDTQLLGDLLVCSPVVVREAAEQGKDVAAHCCHMLVHGMLHLLGHDHETDAEAAAMESLEIHILAACGLENPYKERRLS